MQGSRQQWQAAAGGFKFKLSASTGDRQAILKRHTSTVFPSSGIAGCWRRRGARET
jgi:hypothetical protein